MKFLDFWLGDFWIYRKLRGGKWWLDGSPIKAGCWPYWRRLASIQGEKE